MPTTGSERDGSGTGGERDGPGGHIGLLRSPTPQRHDRIQSWLHAAVARGDKVAAVAVPADLDIGGRADEGSGIGGGIDLRGLPVLTPTELRRQARQARLVERALAEGYRGLSVLIWADAVIAAVSPQGHAAIETSLAELCREHPISVLCDYDRGGAGTQQLDMAVTHHPDELRDQQAFVHHDRHRLALGGEFDISNLDVLSTALRTLTAIGATGDAPPAVPTLDFTADAQARPGGGWTAEGVSICSAARCRTPCCSPTTCSRRCSGTSRGGADCRSLARGV